MKPYVMSLVAGAIGLTTSGWSQHEFPLLVEENPFITYIIAQDDSLGAVRNHACETASLEQSIRDYTDALSDLDFSNCPEDFTSAFRRHIKAWQQLIPYVKQYPDLRGEMHDLFDQLENGEDGDVFKALVDEIRSTWREVEKAIE